MLKIDSKTVEQCIERTQKYLLSRQHPDGYWVGILEADVSVTSGFIPLMRFLGIRDRKLEKKAINYFLYNQNNDGSWSLYLNGKGSLDVTIQTYLCFKMCGISKFKPFMEKAKNFIISNGGIEKANTYTRIILALFGQYSWKAIPEIPPEIIFLPRWFFINIYDFASWARATIMAFSIIISFKPVFKLKKDESVFELYRNLKEIKNPKSYRIKQFYSLENVFILLNYAFKLWDKLPDKFKPKRKLAIKKVEEWILDHQEQDGSWGGIMLPWLFSLIALNCLGYNNNHPVIKKGLRGLKDFMAENSSSILLQPATSPVWDTAWTIIALRESGVDGNCPELVKGARWLLSKQITIDGDWKVKNPKAEAGCWSFEFENKFYPDIDDTSVVCVALDYVNIKHNGKKEKAINKGIRWVLDMQNSDGSWAAFDKDNNKKLLKKIPFADFITPLDYGSPDITAHVLMVLFKLGFGKNSSSILRAIEYLKNKQLKDGSWHGRWGVNYIYGTSKVLQAMETLSKRDMQNWSFYTNIENAIRWLKSCQNKDGGWGESCRSYEIGKYCGLGESTASQTAWAILGLLSVEDISEEVKKGMDYLLNTQYEDGSWYEEYFTGGGFPGAFYLKYELYKDYFSLMAMGRYKNCRK